MAGARRGGADQVTERLRGSQLFDAVYSAPTRILGSHGVSRVSYSMEDRDLLLDFGRMVDDPDTGTAVPIDPGAAVIPMSLVADGYRSVLGMVIDLAFRCGVLNHHLGGEAPQHTSGIVAIDEIDMHLHPSWQTHVLRDLAAAFPRVQFVVTTYNPFILSSIEGDCVRQISSDDGRSSFVAPMRHTLGTRIEGANPVASRGAHPSFEPTHCSPRTLGGVAVAQGPRRRSTLLSRKKWRPSTLI